MATQEPATQVKKPRSSVERAIVWGVIAILLIVVAVEFWERRAFQRDYDALTEALRESESTQFQSVTEQRVKSLVKRYSGYTSEKGLPPNGLAANRVDTYRYPGLTRDRVMYVYYGHQRPGEEAEVISMGTEKADTFDEAVAKTIPDFNAFDAAQQESKKGGQADEPSASGKADAANVKGQGAKGQRSEEKNP